MVLVLKAERGSWRVAEDWHCVAGSESLRENRESPWWRWNLSCSKDTEYYNCLDCGMSAKNSGWCGVEQELQDKLCDWQMAKWEMWDLPSPSGPRRSWTSEFQMLDTDPFQVVGFWFYFDLIVITPWSFSLRIRIDITLKVGGTVKRLWT